MKHRRTSCMSPTRDKVENLNNFFLKVMFLYFFFHDVLKQPAYIQRVYQKWRLMEKTPLVIGKNRS